VNRPRMVLSVGVVLLLCGCTLPRIIVLNDPLDARQHNDLGISYEQRGDYDLARREFQRAAELEKKWLVPLINLGNVHAHQTDWPAAIASYQQVLQVEPDNPEALNNLAWVLVQAGRPAEALPLAQRAVALNAGNPSCWDTLADVYLALDRLEDAREAVVRGLSLNPPPELRTALESKLTSN